MKAVYSVTNKDLTLYNKNGVCLAILNSFDINEIMNKYHLSDNDVSISL